MLTIRRFGTDSIRILLIMLASSTTPLLGQQSSEPSQVDQQPEKARRVIEEVIVSAQKVDEVSQKVPISMSVMTGQFIADQGLTDIEAALDFTPNFEFDSRSAAGVGATPRCRGFGVAADNAAFEPPCGVAIDGVAYTRSVWFAASLFDAKRLEVLRGPQGTTFGKNTTAGMVSLITKDPTDELTASLNVQQGQRDLSRVEVGLGGPLIPGFVNFRVAVLKQDEDGFVENTAAARYDVDQYSGANETEGYRIKIQMPDLFGSELKLTYESVDTFATGQLTEFANLPDALKQWARQYDPNADFEKGNYIASSLPPVNTSPIQIDRIQLDWDYSIADWDIDLVIANGEIENKRSDAAGTVASSIFASIHEKNPAKTVELRSFSPPMNGIFGLDQLFGMDLGESDLLVGVYYQKLPLDVITSATINDYTIAAELVARRPEGVILPPWEQTPLGILGQPEPTETLTVNFNQVGETQAAFARFRWYPTTQWLFQVGMRYSEETKDATWEADLTEPAPLYTAAFRSSDYTAARSIDDTSVQPKFTLGYSPTDDLNFFFHWTRGFKAGGFIAFTSQAPETTSQRQDGLKQQLDYKREVATEWGADAKLRLLDGAMQLNVSIYQMDIEDFQVFTNVPNEKLPDGSELPGTQFFSVINAAKARARGVEADLTWLPNNWLSLVATLGLNDTEYLDFPIYPCAGISNNDGDDDPRCSAAGKSFERTPKWNSTITTDVRFPVFGDYEVFAGGTVAYKSKMFYGNVLQTNDFAMRPPSYELRANFGVSNPGQGWSLKVVATNLNDKTRYAFESMDSIGVTSHVVEKPRTVYAQLLWEY